MDFYFGTDGECTYTSKTKYHWEKKKSFFPEKKTEQNKSLTVYLYTEKNCYDKAHTWIPIGFPLGQHHDMYLKKSDFSCLGSFLMPRFIYITLLSAINTNINYFGVHMHSGQSNNKRKFMFPWDVTRRKMFDYTTKSFSYKRLYLCNVHIKIFAITI